ncbi:MAG: NUDIX domain-containing protein [Saprospiraceae bacterium]
MKTAVIIARFQTPYLHEGHIRLIEDAKAKHAKVVIVLGISPVVGSRRNPYDYFTRERMIKKAYPEIIVLPLCDHPNDKKWSEQLDHLLTTTFPCADFLLFGGRDSFIPYYLGKFLTIELQQYEKYNATAIRKKLADQVSDSPEFRAGVVYAYFNQYTKVYPTVDIAVFRNNKSEILLGKKLLNNKWRLVGGYANPTDDSYEQAAFRELQEECGSIKVSEMKYFMSIKVDDWRYRRETDKIITSVFSCDYISGKVEAKDDIDELSWFPVDQLSTMIANDEITEEHLPIFKNLISTKVNNNTLTNSA